MSDLQETEEMKNFAIKDCALIALATGKRAQNLRELRNFVAEIELDSIYYHFWGGRLRPRFDDPEFHNDFAVWARHGLHDKVLAERLSLIDPTLYTDLDDLRTELLEVIEARLDELEYPPLAKYDDQFEFIRSQIVIFDTHQEVSVPEEFVPILPRMSVGSIFYHFIDARSRNDSHLDDFQNWMRDLDPQYVELCDTIHEIDPYFCSLVELRAKLVRVFESFFGKVAA
ncbi:MAG: hypothetical protein D6743_15365 [Calditrichaeota bacterium]|nr:MAG: hypothetical protein D6743_15365 [Calditrichota bacterium]